MLYDVTMKRSEIVPGVMVRRIGSACRLLLTDCEEELRDVDRRNKRLWNRRRGMASEPVCYDRFFVTIESNETCVIVDVSNRGVVMVTQSGRRVKCQLNEFVGGKYRYRSHHKYDDHWRTYSHVYRIQWEIVG